MLCFDEKLGVGGSLLLGSTEHHYLSQKVRYLICSEVRSHVRNHVLILTRIPLLDHIEGGSDVVL